MQTGLLIYVGRRYEVLKDAAGGYVLMPKGDRSRSAYIQPGDDAAAFSDALCGHDTGDVWGDIERTDDWLSEYDHVMTVEV